MVPPSFAAIKNTKPFRGPVNTLKSENSTHTHTKALNSSEAKHFNCYERFHLWLALGICAFCCDTQVHMHPAPSAVPTCTSPSPRTPGSLYPEPRGSSGGGGSGGRFLAPDTSGFLIH